MVEHDLNSPGMKGLTGETLGTSADAATTIAPAAQHLQLVVLRTLFAFGTATVLETVAATSYSRESLQPRFSELIQLGLVEPTGERRRNPSGRSAAVLRLTYRGRQYLIGGQA